MTVGCSPPGLEHKDVCFPSPTQGSLASYFCSLKMTAMISSKQVLSVQLFPCYLILIFWLLSSSWQPIPLLVKTYFFLNSYIAYSSATIILLFPPVFEMTLSSWFITSFYTAANNTILLLTCFHSRSANKQQPKYFTVCSACIQSLTAEWVLVRGIKISFCW